MSSPVLVAVLATGLPTVFVLPLARGLLPFALAGRRVLAVLAFLNS